MLVVIDYRAGNLYNVGNALRYLGAEFSFSGDPGMVRQATRIILPGVGSARAAMDSLDEQGLTDVLRQLRVPFLGICLGLQLLFQDSEEEQTPCLGILQGQVRKFDASRVKVPQIGWNRVNRVVSDAGGFLKGEVPLLEGIPEGTFFYFVHSYYASAEEESTIGVTNYGTVFASVVKKDNFWGVQFHPERSGEMGLQVLKNFLEVPSECW